MFDIAPSFSLKGQTAVVTGGVTGIGLAITRCMVAAGAKVVAVSTNENNAAHLREFGDRAAYCRFDITDTERTQEIADRIIAEYGKVGILVNNAGSSCKKPIEDMSVGEFCAVLNVHLVGSFALCKAFIPHMKSNGKGSILFQASMTSFLGLPYVVGYSAAKSGVLGMVHTLAGECAADGIRVNAIAPGWIDTPLFRQVTSGDTARLNKIMSRIPMNRIGDPMDVGMAAVFLCSDAAGYINGACLPVDGGGLIGF